MRFSNSIASAALRNTPTSCCTSRFSIKSLTHFRNDKSADPDKEQIFESNGAKSDNLAFNSCSNDQAASPKSINPTMRALPLSVWNTRRKLACAPPSFGLTDNSSSVFKPLDMTSSASS